MSVHVAMICVKCYLRHFECYTYTVITNHHTVRRYMGINLLYTETVFRVPVSPLFICAFLAFEADFFEELIAFLTGYCGCPLVYRVL